MSSFVVSSTTATFILQRAIRLYHIEQIGSGDGIAVGSESGARARRFIARFCGRERPLSVLIGSSLRAHLSLCLFLWTNGPPFFLYDVINFDCILLKIYPKCTMFCAFGSMSRGIDMNICFSWIDFPMWWLNLDITWGIEF